MTFRDRSRLSGSGNRNREASSLVPNNIMSCHILSPWTDWVEQCQVDLLGSCDDNCASRHVLGESWQRNGGLADGQRGLDLRRADYAIWHDDVLEALLQEQQMQLNSASSFSSSTLDSSFEKEQQQEEKNDVSAPVTGALKSGVRKRPLRRRNTSPMRNTAPSKPAQVTPLRAKSHFNLPNEQKYFSSRNSPVTVTGSTRSNVNNNKSASVTSTLLARDPGLFLHPLVQLQKDKGKGEPIGTAVCANGVSEVLQKLRSKMKVITELAIDAKKGSATMKRKQARVSMQDAKFIETRSVLELRMGFLSIQYGVLLRWDVVETGQVVMVVLRKMCYDHFYPSKSLRPTQARLIQHRLDDEKAIYHEGDAISPRTDGTEVTLLEPPYAVPRPEIFEPAQLGARIVSAKGLSPKSSWTVQLSHESVEVWLPLSCDKTTGSYVVKASASPASFSQSLAPEYDLQGSIMEIVLWESPKRRPGLKRAVAKLPIPLHVLGITPVRMSLPLHALHRNSSNVDVGSLELELAWKSPHQAWLDMELRARRRLERQPSSPGKPVQIVMEEEPPESKWDWICYLC